MQLLSLACVAAAPSHGDAVLGDLLMKCCPFVLPSMCGGGAKSQKCFVAAVALRGPSHSVNTHVLLALLIEESKLGYVIMTVQRHS
jgi:hypothetical protein